MKLNSFFEKLIDSLRVFTVFILVFLAMQLALRLFEFSLANYNHHAYAFSDALIGYFFDILFVFSFSVKVFILYFLLYLANKKISKVFLSIVLIVFAIAGYGFARYFGLVMYPVDKVLFSYSIKELLLIMQTGGGFDLFSIGSILIFGLVLFFSNKYFRKIQYSKTFILIMILFMIVSFAINRAVVRNTQNKCSEETYHIRANKTCYFLQEVRSMLKQKQAQRAVMKPSVVESFQSYYPNRHFTNRNFPLLHIPNKTSVLANLMRKGERPPNIVIIIVESLTRCYSGPNAWAGSYTPFLDSLAKKSLYWENCTSTSERTVGVLPGVLGSLPSANEGFSAMAGNMPNHLSLISILKKNGYHTNFFYGGDPSFDNTNIFLSRQGNQLIQSGTYYKKNGQVFWGAPDSNIYKKSLDYRKNYPEAQPYLSVYLTLSTHGPFDFPGLESTKRFLLEKWSKHLTPSQQDYLKDNTSKLASYYYTDQQIKRLFYGLKALGEMENTIFIVTGDHGVVQVCTENPIQRYHIPLILYSPKLKRAKSIKAVNSHYNITPSLLAFLQRDYNLEIPRQLHWMGADFDTTDQVQTKLPIPIMQLNRSVEEVAYHDYFLSKGKLFHIANDMQLKEIHNDSVFQKMDKLLKDYLAVNSFVCNHNKLMPEDIYHRWGNIFQFLTQNKIPEVFFDSAVDYVGLWKNEILSDEGNYRIQLDFDLLPTNVEQKNFPEFVLDISNEKGQKLSYNSLSWLREAADFDNSKKNHFSLSIESSIPSEIEAQACSLKAYFWNNREVKLRLENVEVKIYKQKE
jgi:uncharacterized sulfatase